MGTTFLLLLIIICGILLEEYKVWDMIFLDWYLLTKTHFYQHYYLEVEGCDSESVKHTGFNRKEQLMKLCVTFPLIALAGIVHC